MTSTSTTIVSKFGGHHLGQYHDLLHDNDVDLPPPPTTSTLLQQQHDDDDDDDDDKAQQQQQQEQEPPHLILPDDDHSTNTTSTSSTLDQNKTQSIIKRDVLWDEILAADFHYSDRTERNPDLLLDEEGSGEGESSPLASKNLLRTMATTMTQRARNDDSMISRLVTMDSFAAEDDDAEDEQQQYYPSPDQEQQQQRPSPLILHNNDDDWMMRTPLHDDSYLLEVEEESVLMSILRKTRTPTVSTPAVSSSAYGRNNDYNDDEVEQRQHRMSNGDDNSNDEKKFDDNKFNDAGNHNNNDFVTDANNDVTTRVGNKSTARTTTEEDDCCDDTMEASFVLWDTTTAKSTTKFIPIKSKSIEETIAAITIHDCYQKMKRKHNKAKTQIRGCKAICHVLQSLIKYSTENDHEIRDVGSRVLYQIDATLVKLIMKVMKKKANNIELQQDSGLMLCYLSLFDKSSAVRIAERLEIIISAMENNLDDTSYSQEVGCNLICTLSTLDDTKHHDYIVLKDGIQAIVRAMKEHPTNIRILHKGIITICNIAASNSNSNNIEVLPRWQMIAGEEDTGAIQAILTSMANHPYDCTIQEYGCSAISNLSQNCQVNKSLIVNNNNNNNGGIATIINAIKNNIQHPGIQESAIAAIANVTSSTTTNDEVIGTMLRCQEGGEQKGGGADVVISCLLMSMKKHVLNESIQQYGCQAISNLTTIAAKQFVRKCQDKHCSTTKSSSIHSYDGILVILSGMRFHTENSKIQCYGSFIMRNICCCPPLDSNNIDTADVNNNNNNGNLQEIIAELGGIGTIIFGMIQHCNDADVQLSSIGALYALIQNNNIENEVSISSGGGVTAILKAMDVFSNNLPIQIEGCKILSHLYQSSYSSDGSSTIIAADIPEELLSLINNNQDCQDIVHLVLSVFDEKLSSSDDEDHYSEFTDSSRGIEVVLSVMKNNPDDTVVQNHCSSILSSILSDSFKKSGNKTIRLVVQNGGIGTMIATMRIHVYEIQIQMNCLRCLHVIASSNPDSLNDVLLGVGTILKSMATHTSSAEIQTKGCVVLHMLTACCDNVIPYLLERDALQIVSSAKTLIVDRSASRSASNLLKCLQKASAASGGSEE